MKEVYPPQLLAQKLNNRAAYCIESGQFDVAITNLVKALKLAETSEVICDGNDRSSSDDSHGCGCKYCSLDYCMTYSQQVSKQAAVTESIDKASIAGGYVYQQPIRVSSETMEECHHMGFVLPLILTFNLAVAHHLNALREDTIDRSKLQRVLRLYELAYRWQMEEQDIQVECIRFSMAIANNLSEIHRAVSNHDKHQKCLEHLLSTLMFVVDCNDIDRSAIDMDGFLRNTSELFLNSHCAGAA